jgi:hypothetical protein
MNIPDPDPDFFLPIPDPGLKKAPDSGSGTLTQNRVTRNFALIYIWQKGQKKNRITVNALFLAKKGQRKKKNTIVLDKTNLVIKVHLCVYGKITIKYRSVFSLLQRDYNY